MILYNICSFKEDLSEEDIKLLERYFSEAVQEDSVKILNCQKTYEPKNFSIRFCNTVEDTIGSGKDVLDMFSGCGIVGLSFARNNNVTCSDISQDCIDQILLNARLNNVTVNTIQSNVFRNISGKYDVITAIPPMLSSKQYDNYNWEGADPGQPREAYDAGDNELNYYIKLFNNGQKYLKPQGMILLPVKNSNQKELIESALSNYSSWKYEYIRSCDKKDYPTYVIKLMVKE